MNTFWQLVDFEKRLDRWLDLEQQPLAVRIAVAQWILAAADDAYAGARRRPALGSNYWQVRVPNSVLDGHAVVCTFWIDEQTRTVSCDLIATLSLPVD